MGRLLSGLAIAFLGVDAGMKLLKLAPAVESTNHFGYPTSTLLPIGMIELVFRNAYIIPRTAVIGAVLWAGYLGGAIAPHVRAGSPLFTHVLFRIYVAALLRAGLWLRPPDTCPLCKVSLQSARMFV